MFALVLDATQTSQKGPEGNGRFGESYAGDDGEAMEKLIMISDNITALKVPCSIHLPAAPTYRQAKKVSSYKLLFFNPLTESPKIGIASLLLFSSWESNVF